MSRAGDAEALIEAAIKAEESWQFEKAYRLFVLASRSYEDLSTEESLFALVQAATCLEKSQTDLAHSALWETIGDRLGTLLHTSNPFKKRDQPGRLGFFHVHPLEKWMTPQGGYYGDDKDGIQRHQQVLAYLWAGEESERRGRHGHAAYLYRKAAIAWEYSAWGERHPSTADEKWPGEELEKFYGGKWERAADTYFRAARAWVKDGGRVRGPYASDLHVGWGSFETPNLPADSPVAGTDTERMMRCWHKYAAVRADFQRRAENRVKQFRGLPSAANQLAILQDMLARQGVRKEAAKLYRQRHKILISIDRQRWSPLFPIRWLFHRSTGSASSVPATLTSLAIVYAVIFPAIYFWGGLLTGTGGAFAPSFGDAILFSLATVVTLSQGDVVSRGAFGESLAVLEALSAYFSLGFVIWMMFRSYEE